MMYIELLMLYSVYYNRMNLINLCRYFVTSGFCTFVSYLLTMVAILKKIIFIIKLCVFLTFFQLCLIFSVQMNSVMDRKS